MKTTTVYLKDAAGQEFGVEVEHGVYLGYAGDSVEKPVAAQVDLHGVIFTDSSGLELDLIDHLKESTLHQIIEKIREEESCTNQ